MKRFRKGHAVFKKTQTIMKPTIVVVVDCTLSYALAMFSLDGTNNTAHTYMCLSTRPILGGVSSITSPCWSSSYRALAASRSCLIISISASPEFSWLARRGSMRIDRRLTLPWPGERAAWREPWRGGIMGGADGMGLLDKSLLR